jgi:outer membrane protein OmpA-like peptidoglycan-associated protein
MITLVLTTPLLGSSLNGKVTRAWSTAGVGDVIVTVSAPDGKALQTVKTDADGNFAINQLPKGQRIAIKYTRDHYQESPTYHYLTLAEGTNNDFVRMSPDDAPESQYREYGARLFHDEATGTVDDETRTMLAHLSPAQRALVADAYASLVAGGHGEDAEKQARTRLLASFDTAASAERKRDVEENLNAIASRLSWFAFTKRDERGVVVTIPTDFKPGQTDVPGNAQAQYNFLAAMLKANPDLKITVEGHADPTGPRSLNDAISAKRAESVRRWLVKGGVPAEKVNALGAGEGKPSDAAAAERRVDVILTPLSGVS